VSSTSPWLKAAQQQVVREISSALLFLAFSCWFPRSLKNKFLVKLSPSCQCSCFG